jgi:hypothetical protein
MKPARARRVAYDAAIEAVNALVATLDEGDEKEATICLCDALLTLRYGPFSYPPANLIAHSDGFGFSRTQQ